MSDQKLYVRNRTDQGVHLPGHGVIPPGKTPVEVINSEVVAAAIEQRVLEETDPPKQDEAPKRRTTTDKDKEGGQ